VRKPRTREARFAGLIPGRCVEIAAPFHAHCRQEAARNLSCGSAKSEARGDGLQLWPAQVLQWTQKNRFLGRHRKTGYSAIHWCFPWPSSTMSRSILQYEYPPRHGKPQSYRVAATLNITKGPSTPNEGSTQMLSSNICC
jgi:hypothetical protein